MLNQNLPTPLYEQLKNLIKDDIDAGVYKIGEKLLSEPMLEEKYHISRITVRRAIKELCKEEILERKQGKGTFVLGHSRQNRLDQIVGFHESMKRKNKLVSIKILEKSLITPKTAYAKYLQIGENEEVIFLKRLMCADGAPRFIDIGYIPSKAYPNITDKIEDNTSLFKIFKEDYKKTFESFHKVLTVKTATKEIAELLNCAEGEALFSMFKITYDENKKPIYISISILIAKNTSYVISSTGQEKLTKDDLSWNT